MRFLMLTAAALAGLVAFTPAAQASGCGDLPNHAALKDALTQARKEANGGLNYDMWGTVVDRSGMVCAVVYTGDAVDAQWPGSRIISETKANTANAFSLKGGALSTANLYAATQPGGFLFGIQQAHPLDTSVAYKGPASAYGTPKDPMVGHYAGGATVFGGGLALYNDKGEIVGGLGVSGDTACADHSIAWRTRNMLKLDYVPSGVASDKSDQIIYDMSGTKSTSGFGHPTCGGSEKNVLKTLPAVEKIAAEK